MYSRRDMLKVTAAGAVGAASLQFASPSYASRPSMQGQKAPELTVSHWIDGSGNRTEAFRLSEHKGKWVYLKCFQDWCPACHSIGFPNLQKLVEAFPTQDKVVPVVIQTTFEGHSVNTASALRKNQLRYDLDLVFGHDAGNVQLHSSDPNYYPATMRDFATGGTPWVVVINPEGTIAFSDFHINIDAFIDYLNGQVS